MRAKYPEAEIVKDIVRSINYKRKGLKAILGRAMRGNKLEVVVAHKDRLARFGFELIEWVIQQSAGKIVVLKQTTLSPEQELTNDLLSILHVFSCRMHGLRNYKNQVRQALSEPKTEFEAKVFRRKTFASNRYLKNGKIVVAMCSTKPLITFVPV